MAASFDVRLESITPSDTVPGRFHESGLAELVAALGGSHEEGADIYKELRAVFETLDLHKLGERLLDEVLVEPPIPAGCDALLQRMRDPKDPPWADHEVRSDRFWLWYAHRVAHGALPETFPRPPIHRVTLDVCMLVAGVRPPGARATPHDRTVFAATALSARPGSHRLASPFGDLPVDDWAFDVVWAAEVSGRRKPDAEELEARGADPALAGKLFSVQVAAWLAPQWTGDIPFGSTWKFPL